MLDLAIQIEILELHNQFQLLTSHQQRYFLEQVQDEYAGIDDITSSMIDSIVYCMYLAYPEEEVELKVEETLQVLSERLSVEHQQVFLTVLRNITELLEEFSMYFDTV